MIKSYCYIREKYMRKFLILFFAILFSSASVFADDLKFAQVDGTFLNAYDEASINNLRKIVQDINKQKDVSFVVFSGNNIFKPEKQNLKTFLKQANKLNCPYYVVLGQKDVNKRKHFGKAEYIKLVNKKDSAQKKFKQPNFAFEKKGVVFIVADGSKEVLPMSNGYYRPEVLEWVDETLNKYSKKNVVILQHYPIVPPAQKEDYYTIKADDYMKIITAHKNVKAVISGHFNVNKEQEVNGVVHISTANTPKYRIIEMTDCSSQNPTFWSTIKE